MRVRLRVIGGYVDLVEGVPATRGDCPTARPCGHYRCRYHLWLALGEDRPGRRVQGKSPPTTLRAAWLEDPVPPSCALDVAALADQRDMNVDKLADMLGVRQSQFREVTAKALAKLRARADEIAAELDRRR